MRLSELGEIAKSAGPGKGMRKMTGKEARAAIEAMKSRRPSMKRINAALEPEMKRQGAAGAAGYVPRNQSRHMGK